MTAEIQQLIEKQNSIRQDFIYNNAVDIETLNYIAGVDLAYWEKGGVEVAVGCIVVLDYETHEEIEKVAVVGEIEFPYIPGFLAFREVPLILEANKKLTIEPDIYMFDGNGYLHPRHMGVATHAGILLNKPSIGVAKSYYRVGNTEFEMPDKKLFSYTDIIIHGDVYGRAFRSHKNGKPIFLSVGNMIYLDTATSVVEEMIMKESRIPLPILLADAETRNMRKVYSEGS